MQLIGQAIRHKTFGKGIVTGLDEHVLTVCFSGGDKKFIYPDAFGQYLTLRNSAMQEKIRSLLAEQTAQEKAHWQAVQDAQERKYRLQHFPISQNSQTAFHLDTAQAEQTLHRWSVSTGTYLSGSSKGEPRVPDRMKPNSLCLLTCRAADAPEEERRIVGLFMAPEDFFGIYCRDGMIPAHPIWRAALAEPEQPLFWPYFSEGSAVRRWGKTAMKYFTTAVAERILFDLCRSGAAPRKPAGLPSLLPLFLHTEPAVSPPPGAKGQGNAITQEPHRKRPAQRPPDLKSPLEPDGSKGLFCAHFSTM